MENATRMTVKNLVNDEITNPFISLYLATPVAPQARDQVQLTLKNLLKTAQRQFAVFAPEADFRPYQAKMEALLKESHLWHQQLTGGLGVIIGLDDIRMMRVAQVSVSTVSVGNYPDLRPLLAVQQREFTFDLLCLSQDQWQLYHYQGQRLTPVELATDAPTTLQKALGTELRGGDLNFKTHGSQAGQVSYHSHQSKSEAQDIDQHRYYQQVADYLAQQRSERLILFGLPENQALFRSLNKNPHLSATLHLDRSPVGLTEEGRDEAIQPLFDQWNTRQIAAAQQQYASALARQHTCETAVDLVQAAIRGNLAHLLLVEDGSLPGLIMPDGWLDQSTLAGRRHNLLVDLSALVLQQGGKVTILPSAEMPVSGPACGVTRY